MLDDARAPILLTQSKIAADLPAHQAEVICLDDAELSAVHAHPTSNPDSDATAEDLAYIIFTSGSTGKPKGALVTHHNVVRLFQATQHWYAFDERDVWTLFHSIAFDFSVWELWGALLHGGRVVIVPYWVSRSPEDFRDLMVRERVTVLNQTPSAFRQLIQAELARPPSDLALRYVIFGGEALELQSLQPWFERYGDEKPLLVNMYGITETTVHVTYRPIRLEDVRSGQGSVIGVPIPDLQVYVLDPYGQPVPIGVPGEMYIGGAGVARGYLNRPELSEQRFVPDPFRRGSDARLYRSGDRARWLANGDLEYLGRIDDQVKIRGFRIELGEIEAAIARHPSIGETAVIAREDVPGEKRLVAYVVAKKAPADLIDQVRALLTATLPEYMVPAHYAVLPALPLTENGKVDRKALPAPTISRDGTAQPSVAPRTPTEETLARIWSAVLGIDKVGIHEHFFELGGDSILSIQVVSRCRQAGLRLTPKDLFDHPTIAQLAERCAPVLAEADGPQELLTGTVQITPIESWFLEQDIAERSHWNQAFLFELPADVDLARPRASAASGGSPSRRAPAALAGGRNELGARVRQRCPPHNYPRRSFRRHHCSAGGSDRAARSKGSGESESRGWAPTAGRAFLVRAGGAWSTAARDPSHCSRRGIVASDSRGSRGGVFQPARRRAASIARQDYVVSGLGEPSRWFRPIAGHAAVHIILAR